jgi:hypothetical protein
MLLGVGMHQLWLRAFLPATSNLDKQHKITLLQTLFPPIKLHSNRKEKKVLNFQNFAPFILQARSPVQQPSPPFPKKHEERQTTFIKLAVLHIPQSKHTPHRFWLN